MEGEDEEGEVLGGAVELPAAKRVVPKGSHEQHHGGKTGLPHCSATGMGQV